jgi:hypothetical protein
MQSVRVDVDVDPKSEFEPWFYCPVSSYPISMFV